MQCVANGAHPSAPAPSASAMRSLTFTVAPPLRSDRRHRHRHRHRCHTDRRPLTALSATADPAARSPVNISKYKSQRAIVGTERSTLAPAEINALLARAGRPARDEEKWRSAIEHSFLIVTARLISDRRLVGFARATSDRALNGTIWDVTTDPQLPDELAMRRKVITVLLKELRRTVPGCSIALFSSEEDRAFYETLDFVADPDGIRGMAKFDDDFEY